MSLRNFWWHTCLVRSSSPPTYAPACCLPAQVPALAASGERITLCFERQEVRPWRTLNFELLAEVARRTGVSFDYQSMPWKRCLDRLEVLPVPLSEQAYYLVLSHAFAAKTPQLVTRLWDAVEQARISPAYRQHELEAVGSAP